MMIAVVSLLVLGPERLPRAARTVGAFFRKARRSWESLKGEVERELEAEDLKRQFADLPKPAELMQSITAPLDSAAYELRAQEQALNEAIRKPGAE